MTKMRGGSKPAKGGKQVWTHDGKMLRSCVLDPSETYRYALGRRWDDRREDDQCCWVMLNPSTADYNIDDPTVRRCMGFSRRWGFNSIVVVNMFAFRATHPRDLVPLHDPVGPYNDLYVKTAIARSALVVAGWGGNPHSRSPVDLRNDEYRQGKPIVCLGRTNKGRPKHPLYLPNETQREDY